MSFYNVGYGWGLFDGKDVSEVTQVNLCAALDNKSEQVILSGLMLASTEHAILVIAHRLSAIVDADQILVMEDGRIVERVITITCWTMWVFIPSYGHCNKMSALKSITTGSFTH